MEVLKRVIKSCALFLTLGVSLCKAETVALDSFGYLNNNEAAAIIGQNEAQSILNVDVTQGGKSIKKRSGYGLYKSVGGSSAIHGGHHFYDSSGNDVQLWGANTSLYGSVNDATFVQLVSSATSGTTWDCADTQGFAYCVTSGRNALIRTNGATISWYTSPLGTMATVTPERLVVAGVSGAANTLYFSEANNYTNFVTGLAESSPWTEVIAAPGSRITNIEYACGRVLWWKDQSFGYALGTNQVDLQVGIISPTVGTQDNSTAIDSDGLVYFRGQDGHFYRYNCSTIEKLSLDISPNIQTSGRRTANAYTLSGYSDFSAGSMSSTTVTTNGIIISTNNANIPDPSFELNNWTIGAKFTRVSAFPAIFGCGASAHAGSTVLRLSPGTGGGFTMHVGVYNASTNVLISSVSVVYADQCAWVERTIGGLSGAARTLAYIKITNSFSADTAVSPSFALSGSNITLWTLSANDASGPANTFFIDDFSGGASTLAEGTYQSPVRNAPNLTTWDTFTPSAANNGGTISYFMRSSTNSFTIDSSTPVFSSQAANSVVSIATGTYFQWKASFTVTTATSVPTITAATVNWYEGSASDKVYGTYFNDAIWWSVAFGAGQAANNYIFKYDLINPGWTLYDFGAAGFLVQNNLLYFGSPSTASVFRFGNSTSDNGSAISAHWQSRDFPGSDPWLENEYTQMDIIARRDPSQTLTVGYNLNATETTTSYSVSLSSTTDAIIRHKKLLPTGKLGGLLNVTFSDSSATSAWEVLGFRFLYRPLPYKPTQ